MQHVLSFVLVLIPVVWSVFQPILFHNASQTRETISMAIYEVSKDAAIEGRFTEEMYAEFKDMLVENHGYNPACIQISGTEELVNRGGDLTVTVSIPKPMTNVFEAVSIRSCERPDSYVPYTIEKVIKSEYLP